MGDCSPEVLATSSEQQRPSIVKTNSMLSLSAEDVSSLASQVYRAEPRLQPREPRVTVNMLSGTGLQRLYEINFGYGMTQEDLAERRSQLQSLSPFAGEERPAREPALRALQACQYLT